MRQMVGFVGALLLAAVAVGSGRSGGDNDLRALILKAIKVRGGEESHAKYKALVMKGSGTFYGLEEGAIFVQDGYWFQITYQGGTDGASVVVMRLA